MVFLAITTLWNTPFDTMFCVEDISGEEDELNVQTLNVIEH